MATDLVPVNLESYPIVSGNCAEVIRENMGGEQVSPSDLSRIKVPSGGGLTWEVPSADGVEPAKVIDGVIIHICRRRAYWSNPNPTGDPPDCASDDCIEGKGDPGGPCEACPYNEFGSSRKGDGSEGRGKACKESKLLFTLRPGQSLPDVVVIPPGSLKAVKQYQLKLGKPYWSVVTRLALKKATNKDGIAYAQVEPTKVGVLNDDAASGMRAFAQTLQSVFAATTIERSDVDADAE